VGPAVSVNANTMMPHTPVRKGRQPKPIPMGSTGRTVSRANSSCTGTVTILVSRAHLGDQVLEQEHLLVSAGWEPGVEPAATAGEYPRPHSRLKSVTR